MKRVFLGIAAAILALTAISTVTKAGGTLTIFDMDYVFQCSRLKKGSPPGKPQYESYPGVYSESRNVREAVCLFKGALGEEWHPLFPEHPPYGDRACEIAHKAQKQGASISFFKTPDSCLTYNEVANLMSANVPASASADIGQSAAFAARIDMIRRAKTSIRIQYLIFFGDESGWAIAEELKKKKRENPAMKIEINVDALSNFSNETYQLRRTQAMYFDLAQHGITVQGGDLVQGVLMKELNRKNPSMIDKRWHDKIFVIDAEEPDDGYGITGGQNIANEYFRVGIMESGEPVNNRKIWRDEDVLLHGPIVRDLAKAFDNNYEHFEQVAAHLGHESIRADLVKFLDALDLKNGALTLGWSQLLTFINDVDPADLSTLTKGQKKIVEAVQADCSKFFLGVDCRATTEKNPAGGHDLFRVQFYPYSTRTRAGQAVNKETGRYFMNEETRKHIERIYAELDRKGSVIDRMHAQHRFYPASMRWFNSHPRYGETYILQAYVDAINRAEREIILSNAYFVANGTDSVGVGKMFMDALYNAVVYRGVNVAILTNDAEDCDGPDLTWAGRSHYAALLAWNDQARPVGPTGKKGSIDLWEWHGIGAKPWPENTNHSKFAIFDTKEAIVGSYNLDHRSAFLNSETAVAIQSPGFANEIERQFWENDIPKSKFITREQANDWIHQRGLRRRLDREIEFEF